MRIGDKVSFRSSARETRLNLAAGTVLSLKLQGARRCRSCRGAWPLEVLHFTLMWLQVVKEGYPDGELFPTMCTHAADAKLQLRLLTRELIERTQIAV